MTEGQAFSHDYTISLDFCLRKGKINGKNDGYPSYGIRIAGENMDRCGKLSCRQGLEFAQAGHGLAPGQFRFSDKLKRLTCLRPTGKTPSRKIVAPHPLSIPLRAVTCAASPAGTCDVRGVMLHPVRVPPASGSLPPSDVPSGNTLGSITRRSHVSGLSSATLRRSICSIHRRVCFL